MDALFMLTLPEVTALYKRYKAGEISKEEYKKEFVKIAEEVELKKKGG